MSIRSNFKKWIVGFGALGGAMFFYPNDNDNNNQFLHTHKFGIAASSWDYNWDRRDPKSLVKPMKIDNESNQNLYNKQLISKTAKAIRHIILIRHGQYNVEAKTDTDGILTDLGRQQAEATGKRLQELGFPYTLLVHSTMTRAQETAKIIGKGLKNVPIKCDLLLNEGAPIQPDPPSSNWKPEVNFYRDGPRIEAAFRKYFHRADFAQEKDSYTILVCHANIIRYFVCRALQFPPQSWLRLSLNHASITWITIYPDGIVKLWAFGDTGHMKPQLFL
ncbi:serine/threonine-protein phosphatase PGAM5, mitochondrial-like isoform X1 [Apis laboriosa]|uniref:serine/threonine-protein phosphatase PGAM5, mitochondrial-like n=1 Tax=Apis dorsata TaxID=7462 RepID=UPI0003DF5441|nr:serine/threonine-protein phosphatase PGAM5, mitochondrial-like [Apis dorsata]XP_043801003.1 serine/threonine-protein phosphatase PGAM5, mitochondrial-like isoform X1 [Apis laboriosa]